MFKHIIIVLDAGHGGRDPGAIGSRSQEKTNALLLVLALGKILEKLGFTVFYTRKTDRYLTLNERAQIANRRHATIFISVHNNAAVSSATGFETFIYNGNVSDKTRQLQTTVHQAIAKSIGIRDRGRKRANFAVLRLSNMPALLIEYAFISNKNDENILINDVDKLADLTAKGICDYFNVKYETGGLSVGAEKKIMELINAQAKEIKSLKDELKKKQNLPSNNVKPDKSHEKAWYWLVENGISNGERPHHGLTREQYATLTKDFYEKFVKVPKWAQEEIAEKFEAFEPYLQKPERWKADLLAGKVTTPDLLRVLIMAFINKEEKGIELQLDGESIANAFVEGAVIKE